MQNRTAIETIKAKLPIESVVGSYVKLERSGAKFKAKCPFHNEKTASFQVDPDRQFYYCFGCHKGGDIFNFVQEIENIEFFDALKMLAEKAGVALSEFKDEKPSRSSILREIMDNAAKFYEVNFRKNKEVVEYLLGRGLTKDTMVKWRVGYAPKGWSNLYDYLKTKKYNDDDILATGLCLKSEKQKGLYDRFRERIMFPISDSQGRVVAFTGRVMPGTEEEKKSVGKYINSPETDLYHKSSILFGFDKAKQHIHMKGFAIVVEGQMDCVSVVQAGYENTVALSGTACTDEQVVQLARFTNDIAISLDADAAGLVAAQKSAMVAYRHGLKVSVIDIPNGKDPADAIQEDVDSWKQAVEKRTDYITFRLRKMSEGKGTDKIIIATKELFPVLREMQFQMSIDEKLQEIAKSFGVSSDSIRKDFEKFVKSQGTFQAEPEIKKLDPKKTNHQQELLEGLIGILLSIDSGAVFDQLRKEFDELGKNYDTLISDLPSDRRAKYLSEIEKAIGSVVDNLPTYERMFHQFHTRYKLFLLEEEKHDLDDILRSDPNNTGALAKLHSILKEKDHLIHQLHNH